MSQFEYLQRSIIGQYYPSDTPIHRLDPRARILGFTLLILAVTLTPSLLAVAIGLIVSLITLNLARIPIRYALRSLQSPLPFLLILAVIQVFITPASSQADLLWQAGPLHITGAGLLSAIRLILRFSALILLISLSSFTISFSELISGLRALLAPFARLGLPVQDGVLVIQVTLRFIPLLALSAERIAKAQAARGANWGTGKGSLVDRVREVVPLIVPLFLTSLRRAENLALAIDARAYASVPTPTSLHQLDFRVQDGIALAITVILSAAITAIGFIQA